MSTDPIDDDALDRLADKLQARMLERRARMSPEEMAEIQRLGERRAAADAWWSGIRLGEEWSKNPAEQWVVKARAYAHLGFHDFFDGPGPMNVYTHLPLPFFMEVRETSEVIDFPDMPILHVLRDAITAAKMRGRIQLRVVEIRPTNGNVYRRTDIAVLDWDLLPRRCQEAWRQQRHPLASMCGPEDRSMIDGMIDFLPSGYCGNDPYGFMNAILCDAGHPLTPHLLAAMTSAGEGIPLWQAWGIGGNAGVTYRARYLATDDVLATLAEGVVLHWPGTRKRVRIRIDPDYDFSEQLAYVGGERLLHVEPTTDPLTKFVRRKGGLQVFGRGWPHHVHQVPEIEGKTTVPLFSWGEPHGFAVVITATLGADGLPEVAWVDGICT